MKSDRLVIVNRTAPLSRDGWIHIVPKGELPNREAGITQVLDDASLDSILANIERDKSRLGNRWPGLYGGEEHFYYQDDQTTAAFAWFKDFQKREDGIWANANGLTDLGAAAIKNKRFKFTSFVADPKDTEKLGGNRVRILKVETVGFTNAANGRELLTPITNRGAEAETQPSDPEAAGRAFSLIVNRIRRERNCTFDVAWHGAREEEPVLFAAMQPRRNQAPAPMARNRSAVSQPDCAALAGEVLGDLVRAEQLARGGRFEDHWHRICNRAPKLVRIANRQARWDAVADLEPAAHAAYLQTRTNPNVFSTKLVAAQMALRSQFPNLILHERTAKLGELYPQLLSQYRLESAASEPHFEAVLQTVAIDFPDLGFEGRWEKMKEIYPKLFWRYVLNVGSQSEKAP